MTPKKGHRLNGEQSDTLWTASDPMEQSYVKSTAMRRGDFGNPMTAKQPHDTMIAALESAGLIILVGYLSFAGGARLHGRMIDLASCHAGPELSEFSDATTGARANAELCGLSE